MCSSPEFVFEPESYQAIQDEENETLFSLKRNVKTQLSVSRRDRITTDQIERRRRKIIQLQNHRLMLLDLHHSFLTADCRKIGAVNSGLAVYLNQNSEIAEINRNAFDQEISVQTEAFENEENLEREKFEKEITQLKSELAIKRKEMMNYEKKASEYEKKISDYQQVQHQYSRYCEWIKLNDDLHQLKDELKHKTEKKVHIAPKKEKEVVGRENMNTNYFDILMSKDNQRTKRIPLAPRRSMFQ